MFPPIIFSLPYAASNMEPLADGFSRAFCDVRGDFVQGAAMPHDIM